jgi:hypothetical protein
MKKITISIFLALMVFAAQGQIMDTTISYYNFNNISTGNLNYNDLWRTTLAGTTVDVQVQANYSHDTTKAIHFTKNGGGVNASGNRIMDTIFPNFNYADSGVYYLYVDMKSEYWGSEFGVGYDQNNDGIINQSSNNEKGVRLRLATNTSIGSKLYLPSGGSYSSSTIINSGWNRVEIKLEPWANGGSGSISVRLRSISSTTWTTVFSNKNAGLDTSASDAKNPANWNQVFFFFTGTGSGIDNMEFWKISPLPPPPNNAPTDIQLSSDTISENQVSHTFIGDFTTTDLDTNDTHTYSFVSGAGDTNNSEFMIGGNSLYSSISFDYEDTTMKYIRVKTQDQDGAFFEKAFVIYILDIVETNPGFFEYMDNQFAIYPNPANDFIILDMEQQQLLKSIKIYSVNGSLVKTINAVGSKIRIDVSRLEAGSYFIIMEDNEGKSLSKRIQIVR